MVNITEDQVNDILERFDKAEYVYGDLRFYCMKSQYEDEFEDEFTDLVYTIGADDYDAGMSKIVFRFEEYPDFIVKIPITGYRRYSEVLDDDGDLVEWEENDSFLYSRASSFPDVEKWDYCGEEARIYKQACKRHVECMFAETKFIGRTKSGFPIYVSEFIPDGSSQMTRKKKDIYLSLAKEEHISTNGFGQYLVAEMLASYPVSIVMDAINFMRAYRIDSDLHDNNYRFDEDGKFIIIDYSNFNDF